MVTICAILIVEQLFLILVYAAKMKKIFKCVKEATEPVDKNILGSRPTDFLLYL